ncbi:MAG: serine/threonine-protein kinase [Gemmataceae bacterium]
MSSPTAAGPRQIGNYDVVAKIAEGGMGAVYKATCRATGRTVAIKVVPPEAAKNPTLLKRFEQEFKAAALIDHPHVVKALDYCGTGPTPFLVMEFVDGESLGQRVERDGPLLEADAVRLIGQVCEGLHRAHKQGLIHRDVKPDNILITRDGGAAKLTDLGLVKEVDGESNLTRTGRGLGTPHFMAPEQFRNAKAADVRCDVYSLGATLYCLVTGVTPFDKTSPLDCWVRKTKDDLPPANRLAPELSDRVNWAIRRAMAADPVARPASCREFMEDLTGLAWRGPSSDSYARPVPTDLLLPAAPTDDLWYMVYRDAAGKPNTVKGSTDSIRRNAAAGALGNLAAVLVCRTKQGQFQPLRSVPEFRDLAGDGPGLTPTAPMAVGRLTVPGLDRPAADGRTPLPGRVVVVAPARPRPGRAWMWVLAAGLAGVVVAAVLLFKR